MKLNLKYLLLALGLMLIFLKTREHFASSSPGALIQLVASGAQDVYLTGGDERPAEPMLANQNIQKY